MNDTRNVLRVSRNSLLKFFYTELPLCTHVRQALSTVEHTDKYTQRAAFQSAALEGDSVRSASLARRHFTVGLRSPKRTARSGTAGSNWGEHREAESSKVSSRTEETTLVSPRARYAHHDPTHKPRLPHGNFVLSQNGYGLIPARETTDPESDRNPFGKLPNFSSSEEALRPSH